MKVTSSSLAHIEEVSRPQLAIKSERSRLMPVETISTNTTIAGKYFTPKHQLRPKRPIPQTELCLPFSLLVRAWSNPFVAAISFARSVEFMAQDCSRIGIGIAARATVKPELKLPLISL